MSEPRNKFEARLWGVLKKTGRAKYEDEKLKYTLDCEYLPDFILKSKNDKNKIYIEAKGQFDAYARRKMAAVKAQHPDKDIRIVFYNASSKIRKGSNTTCAQWATKHGYTWAHENIPRRWLLE